MSVETLVPTPVSIGPNERIVSYEGRSFGSKIHRQFLAIACPDEEDGGYTIYAQNYPEVFSQGETIAERRPTSLKRLSEWFRPRRSSGRNSNTHPARPLRLSRAANSSG